MFNAKTLLIAVSFFGLLLGLSSIKPVSADTAGTNRYSDGKCYEEHYGYGGIVELREVLCVDDPVEDRMPPQDPPAVQEAPKAQDAPVGTTQAPAPAENHNPAVQDAPKDDATMHASVPSVQESPPPPAVETAANPGASGCSMAPAGSASTVDLAMFFSLVPFAGLYLRLRAKKKN